MLGNVVKNEKIVMAKNSTWYVLEIERKLQTSAQKHFKMSLVNFTSTYLRNFTQFHIFIFDLQTYKIISQFEMYTQLSNCNFVLKNCLFC